MIIERSPDLYCAYSNEEDIPLNGCGETIEECKQNVQNCIEIVDEFDERSRPKFLDDDYEIVYEFDLDLEYKGYRGSVDFSTEDVVYFGKIQNIDDLVSFEGESVPELETNFKDSVDDYLETCKEIGKESKTKSHGSNRN